MPRPKSDIEERILRAAHVRFLNEGVDTASLRAIARDAGTNIGMIYYYFPSKEDLFMGVVEEAYVKVLADLEQALARDLPVRDRLAGLYRRISQLAGPEVEVFQIVLREILKSNTRRQKLIDRFRRGHLPLIINAMRDGVTSGLIDERHHIAVTMLCTLVIGVIPQLIIRFARAELPIPGAPAGEELASELLGILLDGIGTHAAAIPVSPRSEEE